MRKIVLLSILFILAFGAAISQAVAQETWPADRKFYQNDAIGVSLKTVLPQVKVVEDRYLADAFGFTLVDSKEQMVLRVALLYRDSSSQMEERARELVQNSPGLDLQPQPVRIGRYQGVRITGAPGVDPSTYIYVTANDSLYEIVCPEREDNLQVCEKLLKSIAFNPVTRSLEELGLKRAEDVLYEPSPYLEAPMPKGPAEIDNTMLLPDCDMTAMEAVTMKLYLSTSG